MLNGILFALFAALLGVVPCFWGYRLLYAHAARLVILWWPLVGRKGSQSAVWRWIFSDFYGTHNRSGAGHSVSNLLLAVL